MESDDLFDKIDEPEIVVYDDEIFYRSFTDEEINDINDEITNLDAGIRKLYNRIDELIYAVYSNWLRGCLKWKRFVKIAGFGKNLISTY